MMITRLTVCATALVVLSVAGCARTDDGAPAGSPGSAGSAAPAASTPSDLPSSGPAAAETLSGTVVAGVEPNCLLLEGAGDPRLLVFENQALRATAKPGSRVTVSGRAEPGMMSTCMQGTPFVVTSITAG